MPGNDAQAVKHALDEADLLPTIAAVVAGNQFVTVTAAKLVALLGLRGVPALAAECGVHRISQGTRIGRRGTVARLRTGRDPGRCASRGSPNRLSARDQADQQRVEQGVTLLQDETALEPAYRQLQQTDFGMFGLRRTEYLLEAFADGREFSVELALVDGTVRFSGVTEKWVTSPPSFVEIGHVFPARLPARQRQALLDAARSATQALGLDTGVFHIELRWTSTGPRIIETNPRPGGDHITTHLPLATGIDLFKLHLRALLADSKQCPRSKRGGRRGFVVAPCEGVLEALDGWDDATRRDYVVHCGLEKQPGTAFVHPKAPLTGSHSLS